MSKIDFGRMISASEVQRAGVALAAERGALTLVAGIEAAMQGQGGVVPVAEMLSWAAKEQAARQMMSDPQSVPAADLLAEAAITGEAVGDLAARILRKAEAQHARISVLTGLRRKGLAAIAAATTSAEVAQALAEAEAQIASLG